MSERYEVAGSGYSQSFWGPDDEARTQRRMARPPGRIAAVQTANAASLARQMAFEQTVSAAGRVLEAELAAAGTDKTARRAAWARYGDVQDAAGAAFRAAQAADGARS